MDKPSVAATFAKEFSDVCRVDASEKVLLLGDAQIFMRDAPDSDDSVGAIGFGAIRSVIGHIRGLAEIEKDPRSTEFAKAEKRVPQDIEAVRGLANAVESSERAVAAAEVELNAFYALPALDASDAAGAAFDREARDFLRSLPSDARSDLPRILAENPRILIAALRSPLLSGLGGLTAAAERTWRTTLENANPEGFAAASAKLRAARWTRTAVANAANVAGKRMTSSARQVLKGLKDTEAFAASKLFAQEGDRLVPKVAFD